jgi:uncharacterized protein (TIGR02996 family)
LSRLWRGVTIAASTEQLSQAFHSPEATMRTFTFTQGRSNKFWNIELRGCGFTVVYGRIGTAGATLSKTFADEATARKAHDKLVKEKLAKGYTETTKGRGVKEALEEAILENPDDLAAASAYADYLTEQGDPQGELIQVQLALEDEGRPAAERKELRKREKALCKSYGAQWVGEWAKLTAPTGPEGRGQLDFPGPKPSRFVRGMMAEVTIDELNVACARALVRAPQTRFVRRLFLGGFALEEPGEYEAGPDIDVEDEEEPARSVLRRWPQLAHLRVFQSGWTSDEEYDDFCHFQCHHSGLDAVEWVKQMPRLEELYLFAYHVPADRLFALPLPNLRVLQLYHSQGSYPLAKLAQNASLTRLTHLLCHPHALSEDHAPIRLDGLRAVLRSPHLQSLTHLRLRLTDFGDAGCEEIVRSGTLKRLKYLDLRHGRVSDAGAKLLAACPDLKRLEHLDLSRNELTEAGIAALKATGVPLRADYQHASTLHFDPETQAGEMQFLYEGDYE